MTAVDEVDVYLDESGRGPQLVGNLRSSYAGGRNLASASFQYDSTYRGSPRAYALSPDLPLVGSRIYTAANDNLFGAFSDAAPDQWGQKIIQADHAVRLRDDPTLPRRIGDFDFLLGVSDLTRMGALRFTSPGDGEWWKHDSTVAELHDITKVIAAAGRYEADEATDEDLAYLSDIATSPGGARPKANVLLENGQLALAKLPHSKDGSIDVEKWEAVALTLAHRIGLRTPRFQPLAASQNTTVLLVDRFDRSPTGERRGYISAATALEIGKHDDSRITYEAFADTIAEISVDPRSDLREMFGRIALTVLINNVDDHWRNHGFLRSDTGWSLAPVFDVNPNPRRGTINARRLNDSDDPRARDIRHLHNISDAYQLTDRAAAEIIVSVAREVEQWPTVAAALGVAPAHQSAMAAAFDETQLHLALDLGGKARPSSTCRERRRGEDSGATWVRPYVRNGVQVDGYWRQ